MGSYALQNNTEGFKNNAMGAYALKNNTIGSGNNAFGTGALNENTEGTNNNAFGERALKNNTKGSSNNAFGAEALLNNTEGSSNNAFGEKSMYNNNGDYNSAFGYNAGYDMSGNNNCTLLGANTDVSGTDINNATAIGYNAKVGSSNSIILGTAEEKVGLGGIIAPLDALHIRGNLRISNSINSYNDVVKGTYINVMPTINTGEYLNVPITLLQTLPSQNLAFHFKYDIGLIGNSGTDIYTKFIVNCSLYGTIFGNSLTDITDSQSLNGPSISIIDNTLSIHVWQPIPPGTYTNVKYLVNYEYFIV